MPVADLLLSPLAFNAKWSFQFHFEAQYGINIPFF
jgi:hypothetical protein